MAENALDLDVWLTELRMWRDHELAFNIVSKCIFNSSFKALPYTCLWV